jgi:hypothetical protein
VEKTMVFIPSELPVNNANVLLIPFNVLVRSVDRTIISFVFMELPMMVDKFRSLILMVHALSVDKRIVSARRDE